MSFQKWTTEKWEESEAKAILSQDLELGFCSIMASKMSAKYAWDEFYRSMDQFERMTFTFFSKKLTELRKFWKAEKMKEWESKWETSDAKQKLLYDLHAGILDADERFTSNRATWEGQYENLLEFEFMEYGFFCQKLKALRQEWKEEKLDEWEETWGDSEAKEILLRDLENGDLPLSTNLMSAKDAWDDYGFRAEFLGMTFNFFSSHLSELRKAAKRKEAIDWGPSAARLIIMHDLEDNVLSADENEMSAKDAWDLTYSKMAEFEYVPFWQFEEKLKDHRKQIQQSSKESFEEEIAMKRDLELLPKKMYNDRGELRFCMTEARELLREDVQNGMHENLTPAQFQATRAAYHPFKPRIFKQRIYQEVRFRKFANYLEDKRVRKLEEARQNDKEKREKEEKKKQKQKEMEQKMLEKKYEAQKKKLEKKSKAKK